MQTVIKNSFKNFTFAGRLSQEDGNSAANQVENLIPWRIFNGINSGAKRVSDTMTEFFDNNFTPATRSQFIKEILNAPARNW